MPGNNPGSSGMSANALILWAAFPASKLSGKLVTSQCLWAGGLSAVSQGLAQVLSLKLLRNPLGWGQLMTLTVWRSIHRARSMEAGFPPGKGQSAPRQEPCVCNFLWKVLCCPCCALFRKKTHSQKGGRHTACNDCHPGTGRLFQQMGRLWAFECWCVYIIGI